MINKKQQANIKHATVFIISYQLIENAFISKKLLFKFLKSLNY
jgi:hypothetical protein